MRVWDGALNLCESARRPVGLDRDGRDSGRPTIPVRPGLGKSPDARVQARPSGCPVARSASHSRPRMHSLGAMPMNWACPQMGRPGRCAVPLDEGRGGRPSVSNIQPRVLKRPRRVCASNPSNWGAFKTFQWPGCPGPRANAKRCKSINTQATNKQAGTNKQTTWDGRHKNKQLFEKNG